MTLWLLQWIVPAFIVAILVGAAGVIADVWRLPFRRFDPPMWGASQFYMRDDWQPRAPDPDWGKRLRSEIRKG